MIKKNKIVFLEAVQNFGGARRSTLELAQRIKQNFDVKVVDLFGSCEAFVSAATEMDIPITIVEKKNEPVLVHIGINIFFRTLNLIKYVPTQIRIKKKVNKILHQESPDLVIVNNFKTLSLLDNKSDYRVVYFARGWGMKFDISDWRAKYIKRNSDFFFTVSQATRYTLIARDIANLENSWVVPNGIEVCIRDIDNNDRKGIISCGGFLKSKGHHLAIEIIKLLKSKGVIYSLKIIGNLYTGETSQNYYNYLLHLIAEYDLSEQVEIFADIPLKDVKMEMRRSKFLLHLSVSEGMPRVIMEAMSQGCIILGNAVGGMTDLIIPNYNGFLIDYNLVNSYVDKIMGLDGMNEDHLNVIRKRAFEVLLKSYTPQNQVDSLKNALHYCLNE